MANTKAAGIRLQKLLAEAGICSRRAAETMIRRGHVKLNGKIVTELGTRATATDKIHVDNKPLPQRSDLLHLAVNKPAGIVTTLRDPEGRPTVRDLLPHRFARVFPVGRLDLQSTGLLLLTNDGELAARVTHPRYHVPRTYRVKVGGVPDERALARLRRGVRLAEGRANPVEVSVERALPTKAWLRITVHEGRTHLIRKMCDAVGYSVEKLQRVRIGPLNLGSLPLGAVRQLAPSEVLALRRAVGLR